MNFSELLKPMQKSSVRISYDGNFTDACPIGSSKIGGKPDLPPDFEWFYYRGESFDGLVDTRPLSFLAQINCEEARKYDNDKLLPPKGMLYFFYELATMVWGYDPAHKGGAKVYYHPGGTAELRATDFPADLPEDFILPEMPVTFASERELPDFEEFAEWHDGVDYGKWEEYNKAKASMGVACEQENGENINKLLGYANLVQGSMLFTCESTTDGVYNGEPAEIPPEKLREYKENCTKWRLLFQLDSIQTESFELMWGDVGRIYYYINIDDLNRYNFDNCWLIFQCS